MGMVYIVYIVMVNVSSSVPSDYTAIHAYF